MNTAAAGALALALTLSACGDDTEPTPVPTVAETTAAVETTPAVETTEPVESAEPAPTTSEADPAASGGQSAFEGVTVADAPIEAYDAETSEQILESMTGGAELSGLTFEPQQCSVAVFGTYDQVADADRDKTMAMSDNGLAVVLTAFDDAAAAAAHVEDTRAADDGCATFTFDGGEAGSGTGTMETSDVEVAGADAAYLADATSEFGGTESGMTRLTAQAGQHTVVLIDASATMAGEELGAVAEQIIANLG